MIAELVAEIKTAITRLADKTPPSISTALTNHYPYVSPVHACDGETQFPYQYSPHPKKPHRRRESSTTAGLLIFHVEDAIYHMYKVVQDPKNKGMVARAVDCVLILDQLRKDPLSYSPQGDTANGFYLVDPGQAGS